MYFVILELKYTHNIDKSRITVSSLINYLNNDFY